MSNASRWLLFRTRLAIFRAKNPGWMLVTIIFGMVVVLATFSWPGRLRVSGRLVAETATVVIDNGIQLEPDLSVEGHIRLDGVGSVLLPPEMRNDALITQSVTIRAARLTLSEIQAIPGTELTFDSKAAKSGVNPWLVARGGGTSLQFEADAPLSVETGASILSLNLSVGPLPLVIASDTTEGSYRALSLSGKILGDFEISEMPSALSISTLLFGRRSTAPDMSASFTSTILSGSVKLIDVSREETLEANSALQLSNFIGYSTYFHKVPQGFQIGFAGTVSRLLVGPAGFAEDVSPTALDYLYHQERVKLIWGAAITLFAALWKVRSWFSGK